MQSLNPSENKYHWAKLSAEQWRDRAIFILIGITVYLALPLPERFTDDGFASLVLPLAVTGFVAEFLERLYKFPYGITLLSLAIPMGIISVSIGLVLNFLNFTSGPMDVLSVGISATLMFQSLFYGLVLCIIGFSLYREEEIHLRLLPISIRTFLFLILYVYGWIFMAMTLAGDFIDFISAKPFLLFLGISISFQIARANKQGIAENIADAAIAGIIISIMIGIVMIYSSFGIEPNFRYIEAIQFVELANYANYGLLYGCGLYIFSFLLSLYTNEFNKINFKLKNWHMVEAFCFYVFMTLAAPSLFELV